MKKLNLASTIQRLSSWMISRNRRCSSANGSITSSVGAVTSLILMAAFGLVGVHSAFATTSSISISVNSISLDLVTIGSDDTLASSTSTSTSDPTISVRTTNATGYTLGIKASSGSASISAPLTNTDTGCSSKCTIPSITASNLTDVNNFDANTWGYLPSKFNSTANTVYRPAPTTTGDTLDVTNAANSTDNSYNISIAAKVNMSTAPGTYSSSFTVTATANAVPYTITYSANAGSSTASNMPANESSSTFAETVTISATEPTRADGATFNGWCTVQMADNTACTGTEYAAGATWTINQTSSSNSLVLYAMWKVDPCTGKTALYDLVACRSKGTQTNDTNATTGIQAAIVAPTEAAPISSNSGVYEYNSSVFGASSDDTASCTRADNCPIYYYRGILDSYGHTGTYGSDGLADAYPNYVILGADGNKTTADTCWRIVRTTGSGGVKMIYNGKWTGSTCANATTNAQVITSAFNNSSASNGYSSLAYRNIHAVGYTYNSSSTVTGATSASEDTAIAKVFGSDSDYSVNDADSIMKQYIEKTWFTNINAYQSILETSAGYCNDRTLYPSGSYALTNKLTEDTKIVPYGTSGMTVYYFGAYTRNMNTAQKPTLGCPRGTVDLYSVSGASTGNGQLTKPAALLTADEMSFAGSGSSSATNGSGYHANSYLRSGSDFWLLSPGYRASVGNANGFILRSGGGLDVGRVNITYCVRPAISLASGTTAASGSGTATDPWVVTAP